MQGMYTNDVLFDLSPGFCGKCRRIANLLMPAARGKRHKHNAYANDPKQAVLAFYQQLNAHETGLRSAL